MTATLSAHASRLTTSTCAGLAYCLVPAFGCAASPLNLSVAAGAAGAAGAAVEADGSLVVIRAEKGDAAETVRLVLGMLFRKLLVAL